MPRLPLSYFLGIALSPSLTHLSLSYCGLDKDSGKHLQLVLAFIDSKLETLNLQGNELGEEGSERMISGCCELMKAMDINTTVTELNLSDNKFGEGVNMISMMCKVIENPASPLFMLDLRYNQIGNEGVTRLMDAIKVNKKTKIDITDRFTKEISTELNALLKGIKKPKKAKKKAKPAKK